MRGWVEVALGAGLVMADSPVTINSPGDESPAAPGPSPQEQKQMEQAYAQMKRKMAMEEIGRKIKHKIMVLSGKGGVGKSTVSTGLALSLAQQGHAVGILDIDITGPNVPKMMGLDGRRLHVENKRIHPAQGHLGVKVISMAFLLEDEDTPVVWRGPIKLGAIQQFIGDVEWGELDYLIIDFLLERPMSRSRWHNRFPISTVWSSSPRHSKSPSSTVENRSRSPNRSRFPCSVLLRT